MNRYLDYPDFTTASVAPGATVNMNRNGLPSSFDIVKIKVVADSSGGTFAFRVFKSASFAASKRLIRIENQATPMYYPVDRSTGTELEALEGMPLPYDDDDGAGQWHVQIQNNDTVAHTYTVSLRYEAAGADVEAMFLQAGAGAVERTAQDKLREVQFSVRDFGAVGDYDVTTGTGNDDTDAFINAYAAALNQRDLIGLAGWTGGAPCVYIPHGFYKVDVSAARLVGRRGLLRSRPAPSSIDPPVAIEPDGIPHLTPVTIVPVGANRGISFIGEGRYSTVIYLTGDSYFLEINNTAAFFDIVDISFIGVTGEEKLMYMTSGGTAQSVTRRNVNTDHLAVGYWLEGTGNADYMVHINCQDSHYHLTEAFYHINNNQSVCHLFYGCFAYSAYRYFEILAGGNLHWYGGGIVMSETGVFLHLNNSDGSGIGSGNGLFTFNGLKTELRDMSSMLYSNAGATISFADCHMTVRSNDPVAFLLDLQGSLIIRGGILDYRTQLNTNVNSFAAPFPPTLQVTGCRLARTPVELVTMNHDGGNENGAGRARFEACHKPQGLGSREVQTIMPVDVSLNSRFGFSHETSPIKYITRQYAYYPFGLPNNDGFTFVVPKNCMVVEVRVVNIAAVAKQWKVTGPAGTIWLTSTSGQKLSQSFVHELIGTDVTVDIRNITDSAMADGFVMVGYI